MKKTLLLISAMLLLFAASGMAKEQPYPICIKCHVKQAADWKQSIHYENGTYCNNCHGGNPNDAATAMSPDFGFIGVPKKKDIPALCGKCHVGVEKNYLMSVHNIAKNENGPECATCHTYHKQKKANISLFSRDLCGKCHEYDRAERIKNAMIATENIVGDLDSRIDDLNSNGYNIAGIKSIFFSVRNRFHSLTHVVDVKLIEGETSNIQDNLSKVDKDVRVLEKRESSRKKFGVVFIGLLLAGALAVALYRRVL